MAYLNKLRTISHTQKGEPFIENILSNIRFKKAINYIKTGSVIADLGCGYRGNLLKKISNKIKLGMGYDISVNNKGLPKNVFLIKTDLNKSIDNKNNYFDSITALAVLEHVENPELFLKHIYRMLKMNGVLIITTPHKNGKVILEILSKFGLISKEEIDDHKNYFDIFVLKKLLINNGFKVNKIGLFGLAWLNIYCVARKTI